MDDVTEEFAAAFTPRERGSCRLYLISPQEVGVAFADRLKAAVEPGVAAAFQLRVKDTPEDELALRNAELAGARAIYFDVERRDGL